MHAILQGQIHASLSGYLYGTMIPSSSDTNSVRLLLQWFMEGGAMPKLLHLLHDEDASCRTKALLALSCLIRLNPLALEVFRQKRGIPQLIQAADDKDIKVQRYCWKGLRS